jgi:hypothetical protein
MESNVNRAVGLGLLAGLAIAFLFLTLVGCAFFLEAAPKWDGVYRVEGTNTDGSRYAGHVEIRPVPDTPHYLLTWAIDGEQGVETMQAFGFEYDGGLVAAGLHGPMLMAYRSNGEGRWALPRRTEKLGQEKLTRTDLKALPEPAAARPKPSSGLRIALSANGSRRGRH